jgi:hypothetical protein
MADLEPDLESDGSLVGSLELDGHLELSGQLAIADADFDAAGTTAIAIGAKPNSTRADAEVVQLATVTWAVNILKMLTINFVRS